MATGHDNCSEDSLLGLNDPSDTGTSTASISGALDKLQSTMDCVSAGINKMGDAFAALGAAPREPPKSVKRKFIKTEEGSGDDSSADDYDDEDDIKSLLNASSDHKGQSPSHKEEGSEKSVLDDIELSIDDDDDVGELISDKLAGITNKAFSKQLSLDTTKSKKSSHKRPKNSDKVVVPRVDRDMVTNAKASIYKEKRSTARECSKCCY